MSSITTVTAAAVRRPIVAPIAYIASFAVLLGGTMTMAMRFVPHAHADTEESAPVDQDQAREEQMRVFNAKLSSLAFRAHAGNGKTVITSQEIKDLAFFSHDSCR